MRRNLESSAIYQSSTSYDLHHFHLFQTEMAIGRPESCRAATNCPMFSWKGPDGSSPCTKIFCRLGNVATISRRAAAIRGATISWRAAAIPVATISWRAASTTPSFWPGARRYGRGIGPTDEGDREGASTLESRLRFILGNTK